MDSFYFSNYLGLEDPRLMKMGMIAIDTNQTNGYEGDAANKYTFDGTFKDSCLLFPLGMRENEDNADNGLLFMKSWLNGFSFGCQINNVLDIRDISVPVSKWLNSRGVCSSDQMFATRSPSTMNTLFSCFKRYGSKVRLAAKPGGGDLIDRAKMNTFVENGCLLNAWEKEPLSTRYVIRSVGSRHNLQYLYMISGSDLIVDHEELSEQRKKLGEALVKCNEAIAKEPGKYKKYKDEMYGYKVWLAWEKTEVSNDGDVEVIQTAVDARCAVRAMIGISYIYNYLMYARNVLGPQSFDVVELSSDRTTVVDSIDDVIDAYEPTYTYLRNIGFLTNLA